MRKLTIAAVALVATLALTVPGALGSSTETGVTAKLITIGGTFPQTGPAAGYSPIAPAMKAYFSYINARRGPDGKRGVYGRQIRFIFYDDVYNPANTVQLTRRLVEQDKVFAIVGTLGTEPNLAIRPYLNQRKVPHVFVSTGASQFGSQWADYPWTIGWQPDYIAESRIYGLTIRKEQAGKKIAVLYQNDDYGKDYLYGLRAALGTSYSRQNIVSEEPYEVTAVDVRSQMARIAASKAPVFVILATPKFTIQAYAFAKALGYKPEQIYVNNVSATFLPIAARVAGPEAVEGSLTAFYTKDPTNPRWDNDPAMKEYRALMAKYAPGANANDALNLYGFAKAEAFVQVLYNAGRNLTRAGLMQAILSWNQPNKFLLPGVVQKTSKKDWFPVSQLELQQWNNGLWKKVGPLIDGRPR